MIWSILRDSDIYEKRKVFVMGIGYKSAGLADVRVKDIYCDEALKIEVKNMLLLDSDRLLAGFRETAGFIDGMDAEELSAFMKRKKRYGGGWEDGLIGGHTLGHYITALSQATINPGLSDDGRKQVSDRLDYMLDALLECQELTKGTKFEGYLFGATLPTKEFQENPALQFDNVEKGLGHPFETAWVPWYTMHKILSGLNAAFKIAGKEKGLKAANALGMWISNRALSWSDKVKNTVLSIEYGGMNDCLYELYQINRELKENGSNLFCPEFERFYEAAHCFDEEELFDKVLADQENVLDNVHANTTIPKFIGALARYEADNRETKYLEYAESFWNMVILKHTYVTGGNSENEHFGVDNILDAERTNVNNETCNTYNMLKYSRRLFEATGKKKYLDYAERTFINAILASQNHESGFTTYFQPMATGYQKVFNTLDGNFWCCTGTGYENFTKLQDGIFFDSKDRVMIALFLKSEYVTADYKAAIECDFSKSDEVTVSIETEDNKPFGKELIIRIPTWISGKVSVKLDGKETEFEEKNGFLIIPSDVIKSGSQLLIKCPMSITAHNLQDGKDTYSFMYGPYVLSARLGTTRMKTKGHGIAVVVAADKAVESDEVTIKDEASVSGFIANISKYLVKRENEMEFELKGTDRDLVFTTHYNQYSESYGIYWKFKTL
ncbi:MAG: hypothetical protein E7302_12660 [Butyrivibrio sp.]|nr:hypothetical protein [Butyrivibrio sp.]